jgi:hypothetical protein
MSDVTDPLGSGQTVIEMNVPDTCGLDSGNPAAGTESPKLFQPNTDLYATMSYLIPSTSHVSPSGGWFQLDEIYGPPFGNTPISPATYITSVGGVDHITESFGAVSDAPVWTGPAIDSKWHQVTVHVHINADGSGTTSVYFDGVLQTLNDGTTSKSYQVLLSGNNWDGHSGDYIISDEYYYSHLPSPGPIYHGYQAIGPTLGSVEPPGGWGTP